MPFFNFDPITKPRLNSIRMLANVAIPISRSEYPWS